MVVAVALVGRAHLRGLERSEFAHTSLSIVFVDIGFPSRGSGLNGAWANPRQVRLQTACR